MATDDQTFREQSIRERAYLIWESEGRPVGKDVEHWWQAEREIDFEHPRSWADVALTSAV